MVGPRLHHHILSALLAHLLLIHLAQSKEYIPSSQLLPPPPLDVYNSELREYNHLQAELAWNMSSNLAQAPQILVRNEQLLVQKNLWNNEWCLRLLDSSSPDEFKSSVEQRQVYLVCRGPRFSSYQVSKLIGILGQLRNGYDTTKICLNSQNGNCYRIEPDLNHFMESSRDEVHLREAWVKWHDTIGQELAKPYVDLVRLLNVGARQAGHTDIGACWREEMETEHLIEKSLTLYGQVRRLYSLLHTYVRHKLDNYYGVHLGRGPIPAHLLGNMWGQRWDSLLDIVIRNNPEDEDPASYIKKHIGKNATVMDMVQYAENYYIRLGFPSLPTSFYENSYFTSSASNSGSGSSRNCHGSAANMFADPSLNPHGDFRIMMCAQVKDSDLATIIHEMGHVHYFNSYKQLPTIFQDGANAAFQEAVGDSIVYGMYPEPSINDLLKLGLTKLPQIGFGLVVDLWRWKIFEMEACGAEKVDAEVNVGEWNAIWWELQGEIMGIARPVPENKNQQGLDALGKYHIVDNIPYIRYYQASFLQHMFYRSMCNTNAPESHSRYCKLDGRGFKLKQLMSEGSSKHWSIVLQEMTGHKEIGAGALLEYFGPLQQWLEERVKELGLTIGW